MNWITSWPEPAEISEATRVGMPVTSMWSTVTSTPT
jgi:hypothetical protein